MVQWDRTDSRICWARVGQCIPMDSPTYPTWYSGIGQTVGFVGPEWDSGFPWQSHLSYMVQWDRTDSGIWWATVGQWIPMDSPTCPMVQWDRTDSGVW